MYLKRLTILVAVVFCVFALSIGMKTRNERNNALCNAAYKGQTARVESLLKEGTHGEMLE